MNEREGALYSLHGYPFYDLMTFRCFIAGREEIAHSRRIGSSIVLFQTAVVHITVYSPYLYKQSKAMEITPYHHMF